MASLIFATAAAPSAAAPVVALSDVAPVAASSNVASVTASTTFSSALPPPVPLLPTFPSSPPALSASASRSLIMPASAVVSGVVLHLYRNRLPCCDTEYAGLEDRFVASKAGFHRLTAVVQLLTEEEAILRDQDF